MTYHKDTRAEFRPLDRAVAKVLVEFASGRRVGKTITVEGQDYTLTHISESYNAFWHSRGLSVYYRRGRSVVRISDHWSRSRHHQRSRKLNCGPIATCFWTIADNADTLFETYHRSGRYPRRMMGGVLGVNGFRKVECA